MSSKPFETLQEENRPPGDTIATTAPIGRNRWTTAKSSLAAWFAAFKQIFSSYLAIHVGFLVTTWLSLLFIMKDFELKPLPLYTLWHIWDRKDAMHFDRIALTGYTELSRAAFFPLYPLLERALLPITHAPYIGGLLISNAAGLIMLVVLYRLVEEDFDKERAWRAVLYISIFPTAFFLAAAYNESLFICLSILSFYQMRHGHWLWAGLFGFLACLTRSAGILLLVPFAYEYVRQHQCKLRNIRFGIVASLLIPAGLGALSLYCFKQFHDPLAFSHAQSFWLRVFRWPGQAMVSTLYYITTSGGLLTFLAMRDILDLSINLFMLIFVMLSFVGPWRIPRHLLSYSLYTLTSYLFLQLFPINNAFPLTSTPRYMLELFPLFIVLATLGKYRWFNLHYLMVAGALLFFFLTQYLSGHWIV